MTWINPFFYFSLSLPLSIPLLLLSRGSLRTTKELMFVSLDRCTPSNVWSTTRTMCDITILFVQSNRLIKWFCFDFPDNMVQRWQTNAQRPIITECRWPTTSTMYIIQTMLCFCHKIIIMYVWNGHSSVVTANTCIFGVSNGIKQNVSVLENTTTEWKTAQIIQILLLYRSPDAHDCNYNFESNVFMLCFRFDPINHYYYLSSCHDMI